MASAESPSLERTIVPEEQASFWVRESRPIKQGLKTRIAGLIAYPSMLGFICRRDTSFHCAGRDAGESGRVMEGGAVSHSRLNGGRVCGSPCDAVGLGPVRTGLILFGRRQDAPVTTGETLALQIWGRARFR